ncbi:MAG TPA: glycosyltransferase family 2 protein [Thermoanaerobaculia bacterium]|jgi:GT2 family glycosyltransferase
MRLAIVLVHYHTPELAVEAVETLRADLAACGIDAEWLLVDNGSDDAGRARLAVLPVTRLDPGRNLGFAGGVNLGVAASRAEVVLLMNPDVLVLPGCAAALLDEIERGAAIAGPRFFWDRGRRLVLPPAEVRTRRAEIAALLARRGGRWAAGARRAWRRHARRHWEAERPLASYALSGSLLAIRRSAWERVGPFDERYPLYFEETDWLQRARCCGLPARYVPSAQAVHLYGRSAAREPRAREWFEESARRFRKRHYGAWFEPLLRRLGGSGSAAAEGSLHVISPSDGLDLAAYADDFPLWIEVSPNPAGFPAAGELLRRPASRWTLAEEIRARLEEGGLAVRLVDRRGRELAGFSLAPAPSPAASGEIP